VVTTFTETLAGETVTLMLVTGSVQEFVELLVAVVDVEVVHVMAVLTGAVPQDARPKTAMDKTKRARNFTAPRSVQFDVPNTFDSASNLIPNFEIPLH
jgi:hypothetical protein